MIVPTENRKNSINHQITEQSDCENNFIRQESKKKGVDIVFRDIKYTAHTKVYHREILKGLSGICKSGEMTAIMGSSGAGKTTLLNILCCRAKNTKEVKMSGEILANGSAFDAHSFSNFAAYVMQEDIIMETMTVREALNFSASLKIIGSQKEKDAKVEEVLKTMHLEKCQHSLIGGVNIKGITKGQKKLASIALELVSDPDVIFLDEPTSGLDSFTAFNVVDVLQKYAKSYNKTIICTIHQPSSEIFQKFDRLILLVDSSFIYQGPRDKVIDHFSSFGFTCPHLNNPADYFMSIMHAESEKNINNYKLYFENFDKKLKPLIEQEVRQHSTEIIVQKSAQAPFFTQLKYLISRSFINMKRNPLLFSTRIIQVIILGLFTGILYSQLDDPEDHPDDQRLVNDYNSALFFFGFITHINSVFPIILTFPIERVVFLKEENSKIYSVTSYFFSKLLVECLMVVPLPIIMSSICYFMIGFNNNFGNFCFFVLVSIIQSFVGNAQGMFCGTLFNDPQTASNFTPLMIMPFMLFGGYYKNTLDMPSWNRWIQWISNYRFTFEALLYNNYEDTPFNIDPTQQQNFSLGKWKSLLYLFILFVVFQIFAFLLLKFKKQRIQ